MKIEHDFDKYKGTRYKWYGDGGILCSSGFGCHSNVQINGTDGPATYPTPLWWWFRV